jgi:DNA-directed RNA polymerase specialized sigma24 family protein
MANIANEFQSLIQRARAGDEAAAEDLVRLYGEYVLRVVRRRLSRQPILRRVIDSTDCTQDVWLKLFTDWIHHRTFPTPEQFVAFLVRAAESSVAGRQRQYLQAAKRDLRRDQAFDTSAAADGATGAA